MINKNCIRKMMIAKRNTLTDDEINFASNELFNFVINHSVFKNSECIYLYADFNRELFTKKIIDYCLNSNKQLLLPKIIRRGEIVFVNVNKTTEYQLNKYGIREPKSDDEVKINAGMMIIPLVATDMTYRLGYGGGYYDKYLSKYDGIYTLGVGYKFQNINDKIFEEHDVKLSEIKLF